MKNIVYEVMTIPEITAKYHLAGNAVKAACVRGWLPEGTYRKAGKNWLILREAAAARWGSRLE